MKFDHLHFRRELLFDIALLAIGTALIALLYENNLLLTGILAGITIIGMIFWYDKSDFYFFFIGAIVGPVFESICISQGAWAYANPSEPLNIPIWLWAWGIIVVLIKGIAEIFMHVTLHSEESSE